MKTREITWVGDEFPVGQSFWSEAAGATPLLLCASFVVVCVVWYFMRKRTVNENS